MSSLARFPLSLAVVMLAALPAWAQQGTIRGTVLDGGDDTPLPSANLNLVGTLRGTITGSDGSFSMNVPPGSYALQATFIGYESAKRSVEVAAGDTAAIDLVLKASAVALGEEFVVVGSRTVRTAIETPAPVDVISEEEIRESGQIEINQALRQLAPSFNASHQTISDGTDHINPASLRGLGPDQVLVLINGKRRHSSALVHVNIPAQLTAAFREANGRAPSDAEREVIKGTLFNREERNRFEDALPRTKLSLSARYGLGGFGLLTGATWYGPVEYKPTNMDHDETFDGRTIIDLDVGCDVLPGVRLSVGANNLLNTFPEEHEKQANIGSRGFVYSRRVTQFGVNGGFYYGRVSFDL